MANPKKIAAGQGLKIEFGTIDNSLKVVLATEDKTGGYAEPFSFNSEYLGAPNPDCEVNLTDLLNAFRRNGAKSVFLMVIGTNYNGGGSINFEIEDHNGISLDKVNVNLPTFTSQQWAYQIAL